MTHGYDPDDPRVPTRAEAEEDARLDRIDNARREKQVKATLESLDFADRYDLMAVICPTPWYPMHRDHETCQLRVDSLLNAVARIVYRHTH